MCVFILTDDKIFTKFHDYVIKSITGLKSQTLVLD